MTHLSSILIGFTY